MKIKPSVDMFKNEILASIELCKDFLGEDANYTVEVLENIKLKHEDLIKFIKTCDDSTVKKQTTTYGGSKAVVDVLAVTETKIYKQTTNIVRAISDVITILKTNNIAEIKAFDFSDAQVDVAAKYLVELYSK